MLEYLMEDQAEIFVFLMAMVPVIELRGAIPLGISMGISPLKSTLISILGNSIIVPVLILIIRPIMNYFEKTKLFKSTIGWLKSRTLKKTKDKIRKYSTWGLFLFVAVPLPTTGAWTGSMAASILKMKYKESVTSIILGVITSGTIVYIIALLTDIIIWRYKTIVLEWN